MIIWYCWESKLKRHKISSLENLVGFCQILNGYKQIYKKLLKRQISQGLQAIGFTQEEITATIDSWEYAHGSEKFSHGFDRYPWLIEMVRQNKVIPDTPLQIKHNRFTTHILGSKSLGYLAAEKGVISSIKYAKKFGIGISTLADCYPTGCMGQYTEQITKADFVGIGISHSPKIVRAYGTRDKIFGTTGHSFGFPSKDIPYIYDSSVGALSNGEIMYLHKTGSPLPPNTTLTEKGIFAKKTKEVISQSGIFQGIINIAGDRYAHRLSGFAGSLELLLRLAIVNYPHKINMHGYSIFIALDPELFGKRDDYKDLVTQLEKEITMAKKEDDLQRIYFAGQKSYEKRLKNMQKDTVTISQETYKLLFKT